MTSPELQLIMAALENHREDVRNDLSEMKDYVRCEVGKHAALVNEHERRFVQWDAVKAASARAATYISMILAGLWAIITFSWSEWIKR